MPESAVPPARRATRTAHRTAGSCRHHRQHRLRSRVARNRPSTPEAFRNRQERSGAETASGRRPATKPRWVHWAAASARRPRPRLGTRGGGARSRSRTWSASASSGRSRICALQCSAQTAASAPPRPRRWRRPTRRRRSAKARSRCAHPPTPMYVPWAAWVPTHAAPAWEGSPPPSATPRRGRRAWRVAATHTRSARRLSETNRRRQWCVAAHGRPQARCCSAAAAGSWD
mmetsp:Transcript_65431/g.145991  ORF Transcript_65431/g.145991 Transcript_65431/m.145991 type:complete len:230 (-) Transcript_65431:311-1000(-)